MLIEAEDDLFLEVDKGYDRCRVAFGCKGGKYRSVAMACLLANQVQGYFHSITLSHYGLDDPIEIEPKENKDWRLDNG